MSGILTIVPTPISDDLPLSIKAHELLTHLNFKDEIILVEELKNCRRRWLSFGLPREAIEYFIEFNEHTVKEKNKEIVSALKNNKNVYLMSDCGLPAFNDPGTELINLCHKNKIKVTSTPFDNSVALAIALSGLSHQPFYFAGFINVEKDKREKDLEFLLKKKETVVIMDTPYRLQRLLSELEELMNKHSVNKIIFLALDLNSKSEELYFGKPADFLKTITNFKREFVLLLGPL